jgi:hypothetical protein
MDSVMPAEASGGLLSQLSRVPVDPTPPAYDSSYQGVPIWPQLTAPAAPFAYPTAPVSNHLEPNGGALWQAPLVNYVDFRGPASPPLVDDPFARAARRIRQSVQPEGGRLEGPVTHVLENYVPHALHGLGTALHGLVTLPQRALDTAGEFHRTGEYDPGPIVELAGLMVGSPLTPKGALGSSARRLPMDRASRMQRAREQGYAEEPFYRGERSGLLPDEYPKGAYFSRDKAYSDGFAQVGGRPDAREFRLDLTRTLKDYEPATAEHYGRVVASALKRDPELAKKLVEQVAPGKSVEWFLGFAKANPDFGIADSGAHLRLAVGRSANPEGVLKGAGFDTLDSGRDVRKLTGQGIRLESAAFDPARRRSQNINRSIFGGGAALPFLPDLDPNWE